MDYFKSAATALLAKGGPLPNYTMGERDAWFEGRTIWSLCAATKRDDGTQCSVLVFDAMQPAHNPRRSLLPLAKNALRRLRTIRHPDVVKLLDSAETPTAVYIALEGIRPLGKVLDEMKGTRQQRDEWVGWGLSKIANATRFLNNDMGVTHGNLRTESVFLGASGEWRLAGFELLSSLKDDAPVLYNMGSLVPDAARLAPPEVKQQGWGILRDLDVHVADSWGFALIVVEAYNGSLPPIVSSLPGQGRIPSQIYSLAKRMMLPNAKSRLPTSQFLEAGQAPGGFFAENRLVKVAASLDSFVLAREDERAETIRQIKTSASSFPPDFLQHKVLPALIDAVGLSATAPAGSVGSAPAGRMLPLILQLGAPLADSDWSRTVGPTVLKAFTSPDRTVRITLLEALPTYTSRFDTKQVSDKIWPNLLTGFGDSAAAIREATVKSILPLSVKMSDRILNNDLLRQLARTQVDVEPGIRTNTTILLGNLAPKLNTQTRKKVLVPAFVRSLRDPFVHARNAGLMAFLATSDSFDGEDSAKHILPAMCPCLVDAEKVVRDQAKNAVAAFLAKADETASKMKVSSLPERDVMSSNNGLGDIARGNNSASQEVASTPAGAASMLSRWTVAQFSPNTVAAARDNSSFETPPSRRDSETHSSHDDAPAWSQHGDLMNVMDDDEDWTGFETGKNKTSQAVPKAASNGSSSQKKVAKGRLGTVARPSQKAPTNSAITAGSLHNALSKASLAMADAADDDTAWDDLSADRDQQNTKSSSATLNAPVSEQAIRRDEAPSPAAAFSSKAPWDATPRSGTPLSSSATTEALQSKGNDWGGIDDDDDVQSPAAQSNASPSVGSVKALTKEEKRLEMERKREERRARMAQLKQSKATKLVADLS